MQNADHKHLRRTFELAAKSRRNGNHPFGALLVASSGEVLLEAENTVVSTGDVTAHAERNLLSAASAQLSAESLKSGTMYASTEPCSMCSTAARWAGITRIVYGLSQAGLRNVGNNGAPKPPNDFSCREMFAFSARPAMIIGPLLEEEAAIVHMGFWTKPI